MLATTAVPFDVSELGTAMEMNIADYHVVGLYSLTEPEVGFDFGLLSLPTPNAGHAGHAGHAGSHGHDDGVDGGGRGGGFADFNKKKERE